MNVKESENKTWTKMKQYWWFSFVKSVVKIIEIIFKDRSTKLTLKVTVVRYIHCTECFNLLIVIKVHKHVSLSNGGKNLELRAVKDTKFDLVVYSSCTIPKTSTWRGFELIFFFKFSFEVFLMHDQANFDDQSSRFKRDTVHDFKVPCFC